MERVSDEPIKGRGAVGNPAGRYEAEQVLPFDDEWGTIEEAPPRMLTEVRAEVTKTILSSNRSPDLAFDLSLNPYKGCEHGCIYCYARPSHAWLGLSPGLDFETKITSKPDAAKLLRREFKRRAYRPQTIVLGANTDPYQPIEEDLRISRSVLEASADAGATSAGYIHVRLPLEVATLFEDWLKQHYPDRATRVMDRIRDAHGGDVYRSEFGVRMRGTGVFANLLARRFALATRRRGLNANPRRLATEHFRLPPEDQRQLALFEVA